jgi:hypothetical protein
MRCQKKITKKEGKGKRRVAFKNMQTSSGTCHAGCGGECLHDIEFLPHQGISDTAFCDFVCQFVSKDCAPAAMKQDSPVVVCMEQPCTNFLLYGNLEPQWILDLNGGICQQPCALTYGCAFEFTEFAADEACPLCLDTGLSALVFHCGHMICAQCYGRGARCETAAETLKRCPMCSLQCMPRMRDMVDTSFFY